MHLRGINIALIQSEVSWIKLAPVILSETRQAWVEVTNQSIHRKHFMMTGDVAGAPCYLMANGKKGEVLGDCDK